MRTQDEIVARIDAIKDDDFFGHQQSDLIDCLDYEHAKPYLDPKVKSEDWKPAPSDRASVITRMLDYMPFAWDKANNCRGLSADRSMSHYTAWLWLAGDDEAVGNVREYEHYGKPNLVRICDHYGWDHKQWDDGIRANCESEADAQREALAMAPTPTPPDAKGSE